MTDLSNFKEEDITRWAEDHDPQGLMGADADEDFTVDEDEVTGDGQPV